MLAQPAPSADILKQGWLEARGHTELTGTRAQLALCQLG